MTKKLTFWFGMFLICSIGSKAMDRSKMFAETINKEKSILIFKGETREVIKFDENKNPESNYTSSISYHIINLNTQNIVFFYQRKGNTKWFNQQFVINSVQENDGVFEIEINSKTCRKIYFEFNDLSALTYSFANGLIINYENLKLLSKDTFDNLGIYDWTKDTKSNKQEETIPGYKIIKDFEFSEYWRKESFKKVVEFVQQALSKQNPKCTMVKRSSYNPANVKYIGNQGMQVKLYAEYDCNQNYINPAYFWVNTYYSGNGEWTFELEDHKLTH